MKEIKHDLNRWRDILFKDCKTQHSKDVSSLKQVYRVSATPIKIPAKFFLYRDKIIIKFIWKGNGTRIAKKF